MHRFSLVLYMDIIGLVEVLKIYSKLLSFVKGPQFNIISVEWNFPYQSLFPRIHLKDAYRGTPLNGHPRIMAMQG